MKSATLRRMIVTATGAAMAILFVGLGGWMGRVEAGQGGKAAGYAEAERAVTKLEQEWLVDQQTNDSAKLMKMIADDFVLVDSDGSLGSRDSMIAGYKEEAARVISVKMQVLVAHAVAPNVVVASGLDDVTLKGGNGGTTHRYERFTDTWILRDGRWQCVAEQLTLAKGK